MPRLARDPVSHQTVLASGLATFVSWSVHRFIPDHILRHENITPSFLTLWEGATLPHSQHISRISMESATTEEERESAEIGLIA